MGKIGQTFRMLPTPVRNPVYGLSNAKPMLIAGAAEGRLLPTFAGAGPFYADDAGAKIATFACHTDRPLKSRPVGVPAFAGSVQAFGRRRSGTAMRDGNIAGFPVGAPQLPARPLCIPCYSLFRAAGIAAQVLVENRGTRAGGRPAENLPEGRESRRRPRRSAGGALPPGPRCAEQAEGG